MPRHNWIVLAQVSAAYCIALIMWLVGSHFARGLPEFVAWFPHVSAFLAGAYLGWKTTNRMYFSACVFGFVAAVEFGCVNYMSEAVGFGSDFHGASGALIVAVLSLPFLVIASLFGTAIGSYANPSDTNA